MSNDGLKLPFTGERFTPECVREMAYEHWHRYAWVLPWVSGLDVLDVASGEGYGTALLAQRAHSVLGVDVDEASVVHAQQRYPLANGEFRHADALALPLDDQSVDAVVCFETIEHLSDHDGLMAEFKRVLKPHGWLALSSPDKASYSDQTGFDNPHHVKELYRDELEQLLTGHFGAHRLLAQKLAFVSAIYPVGVDHDSAPTSGQWVVKGPTGCTHHTEPPYPPQYFLALAADEPEHLPGGLALNLFSDQEESVYAHYHEEIRHHIHVGAVLAEKDAQIEALTQRQRLPWWRRWWPGGGD
jgi:2-polyprenyl-3-methyl-5-hydroxy-6-metoxy-1,4-benzoquinol methylase